MKGTLCQKDKPVVRNKQQLSSFYRGDLTIIVFPAERMTKKYVVFSVKRGIFTIASVTA